MQLVVTRTSNWGDERPCEEAVAGVEPTYDYRTCSEGEFNAKGLGGRTGKWRDFGTDHREINDGSGVKIGRRTEDSKCWYVEIADLSALWAFQEKYGEVVLRPSWRSGLPALEIYDTYRE